jgi:small subunit ribosomal protein S17e
MGKVKTEQVKRIGKELIARFPDRFTCSFDENKNTVSALTKGTTTRIRNQIAGYITSCCTIAQAEGKSESPNEEEVEE